ncbi:MAG: hypothetical protein C5B49_04995, partial [Bdellovibrio sp.]
EVGVNGSHMAGPHHMLFEGNWAFNFDSDSTHGNSIYHTVYRNYLRGYRTTFTSAIDGVSYNDSTGQSGPYRAIGLGTYSYWFSFVGNILGYSGMASSTTPTWSYDWTGNSVSPVFQAMTFPSLWMLGFNPTNSESGTQNGYQSDPYSASTAIRDGNYDYMSNTQCWHGLGGTGACPKDPPPNSALPPSMYLTSAPSFFGGNTWPWVDPAAGTTYILPAKARYDAGNPNVVP